MIYFFFLIFPFAVYGFVLITGCAGTSR